MTPAHHLLFSSDRRTRCVLSLPQSALWYKYRINNSSSSADCKRRVGLEKSSRLLVSQESGQDRRPRQSETRPHRRVRDSLGFIVNLQESGRAEEALQGAGLQLWNAARRTSGASP